MGWRGNKRDYAYQVGPHAQAAERRGGKLVRHYALMFSGRRCPLFLLSLGGRRRKRFFILRVSRSSLSRWF